MTAHPNLQEWKSKPAKVDDYSDIYLRKVNHVILIYFKNRL